MKFLILVLVFCVAAEPEPAVRIRGDIYIIQPEEGYHSTLGAVHGTRHCGGSTNFTELRVEGCSGKAICRLPADGQRRRGELEFVPSEDADALGYRLIVIEDGITSMYERPIADSSVQGGHIYIVNVVATVSEQHKGKTMTVQSIIYRVADDYVETCLEADFVHY